MTTNNYINASLEIWGCVMSGIVMLCLFLGGQYRHMCDRLYLRMITCNIGLLLFDVIALFLRGHAGKFFGAGVYAANFLAFSCNFLLMTFFVHYVTVYLGQHIAVSKLPLYIARGICVAEMLLLILTQIFPIFYTIDSNNMYHRASLFGYHMSLG